VIKQQGKAVHERHLGHVITLGLLGECGLCAGEFKLGKLFIARVV